MSNPNFVTIQEAALELGYSYIYIYLLERKYKIEHKCVNGIRKINLTELKSTLDKTTQPMKQAQLTRWFNEDKTRLCWSTVDIYLHFKKTISRRHINTVKAAYPEYFSRAKKRAFFVRWMFDHPNARLKGIPDLQRDLELEGVYISKVTLRAWLYTLKPK